MGQTEIWTTGRSDIFFSAALSVMCHCIQYVTLYSNQAYRVLSLLLEMKLRTVSKKIASNQHSESEQFERKHQCDSLSISVFILLNKC